MWRHYKYYMLTSKCAVIIISVYVDNAGRKVRFGHPVTCGHLGSSPYTDTYLKIPCTSKIHQAEIPVCFIKHFSLYAIWIKYYLFFKLNYEIASASNNINNITNMKRLIYFHHNYQYLRNRSYFIHIAIMSIVNSHYETINICTSFI